MSSDLYGTLSRIGLDVYKQMYRIRTFELQVQAVVANNHYMSRFNALSVGQEATVVGVCAALQNDDRLALSYRCHGGLLARGADPKLLMAEILGKATGYCGGRAGPGQIMVPSLGVIDSSGIVAGQIPVGTGSALATWIDKKDVVTICFFGDGAVSEGAFHESLNFAALWKLPIIYICENNGYASSKAFSTYSPVPNVADRAPAYNIPCFQVDGNEVFDVMQAAQHAIKRARDDSGPSLIECHTQLLLGHFANSTTRKSAEDLLSWSDCDPVYKLRNKLLSAQLECEVQTIEEQVDQDIEAAVTFAVESPYPVPVTTSVC